MLFYYRASISLGVMLALQESPDIVIVGKQSIDGDNNQTGTAHCRLLPFTCLFMHTPSPHPPHSPPLQHPGQMLAGLLDWSQGTFASEIKVEDKVSAACCVLRAEMCAATGAYLFLFHVGVPLSFTERHSDEGGGRWRADSVHVSASSVHRRPAPERAALHQAAGHYEGPQEED